MPAGTCDTGGHFAFWARLALHARRILGAHGHALEAVLHVVVIEILAVELRDGNIRAGESHGGRPQCKLYQQCEKEGFQ